MEEEGLLDNATKMGAVLKETLQSALSGVSGVVDLRGQGLMLGLELDRPCAEIVSMALAADLLTNVTQDNVVRILPPLIINETEAREIATRLANVVRTFLAKAPARVAVAA
jgi:acetylornithine aminotransferase